MIFNDILVLSLTWAKTFKQFKEARAIGMNTPITMLLLRDGTVYFLSVMIYFSCMLLLIDLEQHPSCIELVASGSFHDRA